MDMEKDIKFTLLRNYKEGASLRPVTAEEVVRLIQGCVYSKEVVELRGVYNLSRPKRLDDGQVAGIENFTDRLPRVCFAQEMVKRNKQRQLLSYAACVTLEVNNLASLQEAEAVRDGAARMPQTMMAFVGASGRSVKIVCRGEEIKSARGARRAGDAGGSVSPEDYRQFHYNLYEMARMAYNAQLGVTVEKLEPRLVRTVYLSADPDVYFNAYSTPFYTDSSEPKEALRPLQARPDDGLNDLLPGRSVYQSQMLIYEHNLTRAFDDCQGVETDDEYNALVLERLAGYCQQTGLPLGMAQRRAMFNMELGRDADLVRKVFENAYRRENDKKFGQRNAVHKPLKNIPPETLLTMKIDHFLRSNYELRKNVMRGVAEYRDRNGIGFDFEDLTDEARNSMTIRALSQGIRCWDKDIRRYVNSNDIDLYDPMADFLEHLPQWDGRDRVEPLARRVKCEMEEWLRLFHLWMRSMVAMWQGKGQLTGNALVPLLIGRQGCGKSSFCRILLPREQREYYNDRINFKNESDLNLGLTSFALINLDEFDKITSRQQVVLKYLVSTADLKYRPPYGKAYSAHRRFASFIGTTNEQMPLTDPSGSRRFICVEVTGDIDFSSPVDYPQLYAQLKTEIDNGERYWLQRDEEQALMLHNLKYQQLNGLGEMLLTLFRKPEEGEAGEWLGLDEITRRLKSAFGGTFKEDESSYSKIGRFLNRPEYKFESKIISRRTAYNVKER